MYMLDESRKIKYCSVCKNSIKKKQLVFSLKNRYVCKYCFWQKMRENDQKDTEEQEKTTKEKTGDFHFFEESYVFPPLKKKMKLVPQELVAYLDKNIIGQDKAKRILAVAVCNHYRRIERANGSAVPKSNILIQGPTGTGKTFLLQNLAKLLDVPFTIADASAITEAGYKGRDMESILTSLYQAAGQDIEKTQKGIVYLDEFDKLSSSMGRIGTGYAYTVGEGVQRQMLKMIEGCEMDIPKSGTKMGSDTIKINTENILFICGGAFVGIRKKETTEKRQIGFGESPIVEEKTSVPTKLTAQDFIDYGFIPELIGRLPIIVELDALAEEDLVDILKNSEASFLKSYQDMLRAEEVELCFEEEAIREIAHKAYNRQVGARGLNAIVEEVLGDLLFDVMSDSAIRRCTITKQTVQGTESPRIERDS